MELAADITERKQFTEDICGDFGFRVVWNAAAHWLDVDVYEIVSRDGDSNAPLFHRDGAPSWPDDVETIEGAEKYLSGYIKWDGCSELNQGCPHWCGWVGYQKHIELLTYLYKRGMELIREMGGSPLDDLYPTSPPPQEPT